MNVPLPILGSWFQWIERSTNNPGGGLAQILVPNPNRWSIIWWNNTTATMAVTQAPDGGPTGGIPLLNTTLPLLMNFSQWGSLIHGAWYFSANPVGNFIGCLELVYMPPAMSEAGIDTEGE